MDENSNHKKLSSDDINCTIFVGEGYVFGVGNPILDITAHVDQEFLVKYNLPSNGVFVADESHEELYDDLINSDFQVDYTAGGSCQNAMRAVGWILGRNNANCITYFGTIGGDHFGKLMEKQVKADGVNAMYTKDLNATTGTCAILLTNKGKNRVSISFLEAAKKWKKSILMRDWFYIDMARIFYLTGHMMAVSAESVIAIAHHSKGDPVGAKILCINFSGEYVCKKYPDIISQVLPFTDYVFASEAEITTFAKMKEYPDYKSHPIKIIDCPENDIQNMDIKDIIQMVVTENRKSADHRRVVVVTQGTPMQKILVGRSDSSKTLEFPVDWSSVPEDEFVDRNGMGDAFTGGFISQLIKDEDAPIERCVQVGLHCALHVSQHQSCAFVGDFDFTPTV